MLGQVAIHPRLSAFEYVTLYINRLTMTRCYVTKIKIYIFSVKKDILPIVQSLCQDCYHEVRTAMCYELANIAKGNLAQTVCVFTGFIYF